MCQYENWHTHVCSFDIIMQYCTKCGRQLNGMEKFCTNCGSPLTPLYANQHIQTSCNTKESSNHIWIAFFLFTCVLLGAALHSSINDTNSSNSISSITNFLKKEKNQEEIQAIKDIGKMREAIDNTTWTHTKEGDLFWLKMVFIGDKVKLYRAFPSDGKWTFEEECSYYLEEGRFINDGRRYIAAVIKAKDLSISPKFIITNGHLSWLGFIDVGGFVLRDYEWD